METIGKNRAFESAAKALHQDWTPEKVHHLIKVVDDFVVAALASQAESAPVVAAGQLAMKLAALSGALNGSGIASRSDAQLVKEAAEFIAQRAASVEPMFWYVAMPDGSHDGGVPYLDKEDAQDYVDNRAILGCSIMPLYTAPPTRPSLIMPISQTVEYGESEGGHVYKTGALAVPGTLPVPAATSAPEDQKRTALGKVHAKTELFDFHSNDVRLQIFDEHGMHEARMHGDTARFVVEAVAAANRTAAGVPPITCQIYGYVVGHCGECNVGDEAAHDVADTNKVLADNYLRQTCGTAQPVPAAASAPEVAALKSAIHGLTNHCESAPDCLAAINALEAAYPILRGEQ